MLADLESSFVGHAEVSGDDVVRVPLRSAVRHCKLAHDDAAAVFRPVSLSTPNTYIFNVTNLA